MAIPASTPATQDLKPSKVRYGVVGFAITLAIITYFDRVALSKASGSISHDLHLTDRQMGLVFSAFAFSYALFEIPSGYLGDRLGARRILMRIVIWWSAFTAFMGATFNFWSIFATQLMFGAGEAGCFPNLTKSFSTWLPREERVRAQGVMWLAARWGGAFTPLIVYKLLQVVSWRYVFVIFGSVGAVWAIIFYNWYRDNPQEHPRVNAAEKALLAGNYATAGHGPVPWKLFLKSPNVIMLCLQYFCLSFSWYFYIQWLPRFITQLHVSPFLGTALNIMPLFLGGIGAILSGFLAGSLARFFGSVKKARQVVCASSFTIAASLLVISTFVNAPFEKMLLIAMASFFNDVTLPPSWGACMDVGGKFSGTLSGSMNMIGNFGGALAPVVTAEILQRTGSFTVALYVYAVSYLIGAALWVKMDPVTAIEAPPVML